MTLTQIQPTRSIDARGSQVAASFEVTICDLKLSGAAP